MVKTVARMRHATIVQPGDRRPGEVYGAVDMAWAKLVGQVAHA